MAELQINLPCSCGASVVARNADAGGAISCKCGRSISVPSLSKLRMLVGEEAYVTNPVEAILKAQNVGHDPAGEVCLLCGSKTPRFHRITALCEQSHVKRSSHDPNNFLHWLFLPVVWNFVLWFLHKDVDAVRQGHDREVTLLLPICEPCESVSGQLNRSDSGKKLFLLVPLYAQLLEHYPNLKLEYCGTGRSAS